MDPLAAKIASPDRGRGDLTANSPRQKECPEPAMKKMELEVISERVSKSPTSDIENTDCGNVKNDWSVKSRRKSNTNSPNSMPLSPVCGNVKKDSYVRRQRGSDTHSPNYMPLYPNTSATSLVVSRRRFPRLTVILQISVFLCVFTPSYSSASSKQNKSPLISSTAENVKYFLKNEGVMGRSTVDNSADPDTLDFQTLKVIKKWGNTTDILLVSGRDYVYMLDSTVANGAGGRLNHLERLTWITPTKSQRECIMMGKKEYECHNFIRVVELMENGELMVCGTNAYAPTCRYYIRENFDAPKSGNSIFHTEEVCRGQCIVPFNPATASATLYTNTDNGYRVFTAVVNGFLSDDPIILQKSSPSSSIFTNTLWLNEPTFLKIVEYGDKIYVFFREIAKESESGTSEKVTYARVAQICKNDQGGEKVLVNQWSTFLKSRIRCGYSGHQYMQFDHMTSVSDVVTVTDQNEQPMLAVVATFTTPQEWEDASLSAVCVYSMEDIASVFENGNFLGEYELDVKPKPMPEMPSVGGPSFSAQASMKKITRSYPIPSEDVPSTRPGSCGKQYQPDELYFAKEHPLMYDVVEPYFKAPIYVSYNNVRTTQIAVDDSAGGHGKAMIYLGTKDGKIMRLRTMFNGEGESPKAMLLESTQIDNCGDEDDCSILSLHVSRPLSGPSSRPSAFVAFSDYMVQFPLTRCNLYKNEACCSMDPYCGWSSNRKSCIDRTTSNSDFLEPTRNNVRNIPESCMIDSSDRAGRPCKDEGIDEDFTIEQDILNQINDRSETTLRNILLDSVLPSVEEKYSETINRLNSPSQKKALETQMKEALESTANLVLSNHQQEYCLPSPTVNHLTHVYPLLLREIEIWHQTALKKMSERVLANNCWGKKVCHHRVSFSVPLVPILWEPLTKLISDFSGECNSEPELSEPEPVPRQPRRGCTLLPGMETCHDANSPRCQPKTCTFPRYAVDVKAFFRHANDSRQFLENSDRIEPLWKPVNISLTSSSGVRGHFELAVSEKMPFHIDYSPVAEKVKIMFHYVAITDCSLEEPGCVGTLPGCNPKVENFVDRWFRRTIDGMTPKLRRCTREIAKAQRSDNRERHRRERRGGSSRRADIADRSEFLLNTGKANSNFLMPAARRCKRVTVKLDVLDREIWSLIVSRSQRVGGVYSEFHRTIEFYNLNDVVKFFKNMCTFEEPSMERKTFRKRATRGRSGSSIQIQAMVTPDSPFIIQWDPRAKTMIKYFTMEI